MRSMISMLFASRSFLRAFSGPDSDFADSDAGGASAVPLLDVSVTVE